ncbi:MAG: hypothetical protein ACRDWD_03610 [Acidimicrobiia bacterium]
MATPPPNPTTLEAKLARAYRIDVMDLVVQYDVWPGTDRVEGSAVLQFRLRPGQTRALFHFNPRRLASPRRERRLLQALALDGEELDPHDRTDLRRIRSTRTTEPAFEIQRDLDQDNEHTLEISWSMAIGRRNSHPGWFFPNFDDTIGPSAETETFWPTVSSPEEFTRHRIGLRIHDADPYVVIGSGVVERAEPDDGVQSWEIDTVRPIASHTVFFAAVPSDQVRSVEFDASGVPVTIVSDRSQKATDRAQRISRATIASLVDGFGRFPMPSMHVLLTGWSSGMEYYGATRTGIGSLEHELVHMYFGTATVNRTWRDTWFDEAAVEWWLRRDRLRALPVDFASDIARDRSVAAPGFDTRAYGDGARILGEVAGALGGSPAMVGFLHDLHRGRAFEPFTTDDLLDDIVAAQAVIDRSQLERWLYDGG